MRAIDIYLCGVGAVILLPAVIRFFVPTFGLSKHLLKLLDSRKNATAYLWVHKVIGIVLGSTLVAAGFLPDSLKIKICMPLLVLVFIGVLVSNKVLIGKWRAHIAPPNNKEDRF